MRLGKFTTSGSLAASIQAKDLAVDPHESSSIVRVTLSRAKTDSLGSGVDIVFGRTNTPTTCPVLAILH